MDLIFFSIRMKMMCYYENDKCALYMFTHWYCQPDGRLTSRALSDISVDRVHFQNYARLANRS